MAVIVCLGKWLGLSKVYPQDLSLVYKISLLQVHSAIASLQPPFPRCLLCFSVPTAVSETWLFFKNAPRSAHQKCEKIIKTISVTLFEQAHSGRKQFALENQELREEEVDGSHLER